MEYPSIIGSIQVTARLGNAEFDIIVEGNAYNPTIVTDMTSQIQHLMAVALPTAIEHGYAFDPDNDTEEDD